MAHGWEMKAHGVGVTFPGSRDRYDSTANATLIGLLEHQIQRLKSDGCQLPWLSEYVRYSAAILSWTCNWLASPSSSCFLDESLLHHYGPEVARLLTSSVNGPGGLPATAGSLLQGRHVIMTVAPRQELIERLQARRGQQVHWDWASAYGNRLDEFLAISDSRLVTLVEALEQSGVSVTRVHVRGSQVVDESMVQLKEGLQQIVEETRYEP